MVGVEMTERREPPIGELIAFVRQQRDFYCEISQPMEGGSIKLVRESFAYRAVMFSALLAHLERAEASETATVLEPHDFQPHVNGGTPCTRCHVHPEMAEAKWRGGKCEAVPPVASANEPTQAEGLRALAHTMRKVLPPALLAEVLAHLDPLTPFLDYLRTFNESASPSPLHAETREDDGAALIAAERARQVSTEGWTPEHDDGHDSGEMVIAAVRYALHDVPVVTTDTRQALAVLWRWAPCWWKPKDPIRNLVKAGALIAADIDRQLRAASPAPPASTTSREGAGE
jgi:hypothetical protein